MRIHHSSINLGETRRACPRHLRRGRGQRESASALFVTLVIAGVIALTLAAYLTWANTQNKVSSRSQCWNAALPAAEAGLEEALTQLHATGGTNLATNGWTAGTNGWYKKTNFIDSKAYYEVSIRNSKPPVVVSTGFIPAPFSSTTYIKRRVRVTTAGGITNGAAIMTKGPINLSGNNVTVDSFNSSDSTMSTDGKWDATKARDKGDVITMARDGLTSNNKPIYAVDVGDADIKGHLITIPSATVNVTSGGSVGESSWVNTGTQGIEPGWSSTDANFGLDDVQEPFSGGYYTPTEIPGNQVPFNYVLALPGNYKISRLTGRVLVSAPNVVLWVTDDLSIGSGEFIQITNGASLALYVSAPSATIAGQGVINDTGHASAFSYFGLPTNTAIDYKGNSAFYGTIYAPEATLKLGGGGTTDFDFNGSISVYSLTMNGHYHLHYDESLRPSVPPPIVVKSWNEVDPNGPIQ
jgi:Tfp pilus assembly protein PilX